MPEEQHGLTILYEDDVLLFVDKPPHIVVQRGYDAEEPVLLEIASAYLRAKGSEAILMQRLDRGTSGVLFFSKSPDVNANLTRQFEKKIIRKTYLALVERRLEVAQLVDAPLVRIGPISFGVRPGGKRAITRFEPLVTGDRATLVRLALLTGRTHQIRVHAAAIDHALVGDWLYGERNAARPMLHAALLELRHPRGGAPFAVAAALPEDFIGEAVARGLPEEQVRAAAERVVESRSTFS